MIEYINAYSVEKSIKGSV